MRLSILIVVAALALSACSMPWSKPEVKTSTGTEYSTTQSGSPAAQYCMQNGGKVSYEVNPDIPTMELIYCTPKGGEKIDAWKYMDMRTTQTGTMMP